MGTMFNQVSAWIAYIIIAIEETSKPFIEKLNINHSQWPEGRIKTIVEKYLTTEKEFGADYAKAKFVDECAFLTEETRGYAQTDYEQLKIKYQVELKKLLAAELAKQILKNPDHVDQHIIKFQQHRPHSVKTYSLQDCAEDVKTNLDEKIKKNQAEVIIPNFPKISRLIGGFNPGRVTILLADTGFGKTTASINLAISAAKVAPVLYLNMEMIHDDFALRCLISNNKLTYKEVLQTGAKQLKTPPEAKNFYFSDGTDLNVLEIQSVISEYKQKKGIKFAVVDYDQKIVLDNQKDSPEWKELQRAVVLLETVAKREELCVMLLAQTNSEGSISGSRRSTFSASSVLRFYKTNDAMTVISAIKNRFGKTGAGVYMNYVPERAFLEELSEFSELEEKKKRSIL